MNTTLFVTTRRPVHLTTFRQRSILIVSFTIHDVNRETWACFFLSVHIIEPMGRAQVSLLTHPLCSPSELSCACLLLLFYIILSVQWLLCLVMNVTIVHNAARRIHIRQQHIHTPSRGSLWIRPCGSVLVWHPSKSKVHPEFCGFSNESPSSAHDVNAYNKISHIWFILWLALDLSKQRRPALRYTMSIV